MTQSEQDMICARTNGVCTCGYGCPLDDDGGLAALPPKGWQDHCPHRAEPIDGLEEFMRDPTGGCL